MDGKTRSAGSVSSAPVGVCTSPLLLMTLRVLRALLYILYPLPSCLIIHDPRTITQEANKPLSFRLAIPQLNVRSQFMLVKDAAQSYAHVKKLHRRVPRRDDSLLEFSGAAAALGAESV